MSYLGHRTRLRGTGEAEETQQPWRFYTWKVRAGIQVWLQLTHVVLFLRLTSRVVQACSLRLARLLGQACVLL